MKFFEIISIISLIIVSLANSYEFNDGFQNDEDVTTDEYEVKYVNSGQSVLLVCDLPNSMPDGQVLFIKSDNKVISYGTEIREDGDEQHFEVNQPYAWEWSLKINSINEDDAGVYYCKIGSTLIKQYNIIVRVPPRIRDEMSSNENSKSKTIYNEGDTVKLSCFASGIPKPNISWYMISDDSSSGLTLVEPNNNYLVLNNVTRNTPNKYQCRASNGIPPNDSRNMTFKVQFAPEIEIESKFNKPTNQMVLNCTINAFPLNNKYFWRKDGNYLVEDMKYNIENIAVNEYKLISKLTIKYYNENDQGLYECAAENDLRVSKIVYNLRQENLNAANPSRISIASIKNVAAQNRNNAILSEYDFYDAEYDSTEKSEEVKESSDVFKPIIATKPTTTISTSSLWSKIKPQKAKINHIIGNNLNAKSESLKTKSSDVQFQGDSVVINSISINKNLKKNSRYQKSNATRTHLLASQDHFKIITESDGDSEDTKQQVPTIDIYSSEQYNSLLNSSNMHKSFSVVHIVSISLFVIAAANFLILK